MNDLERLKAADPTEDDGVVDRWRQSIINLIAQDVAENLAMNPKDVYGYIVETEKQGLAELPWKDLVEELESRYAGAEDEFSLLMLHDPTTST